jgi:DNA polymerase-1
MSNLYLIDGSGIAYRAFFALGDWMQSTKGTPTNAVFGVCRMLLKILKEHVKKDEDSVLFVMDKKTKTYRHELLEQYKAQRPKAPEEFVQQLPLINDLVESMGFKLIAMDGFEADDVIGTAAVNFSSHYENVYIITSDKDMMQLVKDNVYLLRPEKGVTDVKKYDSEEVVKKMGVPPEKIIDLLALMGDASDNIPGVKGIGIKTAQKLLNDYNDIEHIYENLDQIKGATKTKLENEKSIAELSKKLVRLVLDVPLEFEKEDLIYKGFDDSLKVFLKNLGFKSIIKELNLESKSEAEDEQSEEDYSKKVKYSLITEDNLDVIYKNIEENEKIVFDLETTSLDPYEADILGVAISFGAFNGYYINLSDYDKAKKIELLKELFEKLKSKKLIAQNAKYDISVLRVLGIEVENIYFDTMIGAYLIDPDGRKFNMDDLAEQYLNYKTIKYEELLSGTLFSQSLKDVEIEKVVEYAGEDADITFRLCEKLNPIIKKFDLEKLNNDIEIPTIKVLSEMELNGVYFDIQYLRELEIEYQKKTDIFLREMHEIAEVEFNPNSPKQVGEILYDKLKLKGKRKTKSGSFSTDAETLEYLSNEHPIIPKLLEYRKYQKLLSTYISAIPKMVNPVTKRVHTSFNQTGTSTGRLSSSEPNLQNLPIKDEEGIKIRKAVRAQKEDHILLSADYSQIELRVLAHISQDPVLIKAYKNSEDIHTITASKIFEVPEGLVDSNMRRVGKMVNFSLVYGAQAYGLSQKLNIPYEKAQKFIDKYFELYKLVGENQIKSFEKAKEKGFVETIFHRKRFLKNIRVGNHDLKRIVINTPIQGTAADIMKIALIKIREKLPKYAKMILQVHDEIVLEIPEIYLEEIKKIVVYEMENAVKLSIPLKADVNYGKIWDK